MYLSRWGHITFSEASANLQCKLNMSVVALMHLTCWLAFDLSFSRACGADGQV